MTQSPEAVWNEAIEAAAKEVFSMRAKPNWMEARDYNRLKRLAAEIRKLKRKRKEQRT